jgi:DNA-binding GntR family transcriptional regulator
MVMKIKGLRETITEYIRTQIISGKLAPGQRLNEAELSDEFDVSRSPLREAFLILESEDLVTNTPRKGTYVTPLSEENMRMIYQVMEMVELYAIDHLKTQQITHVPELIAAVNDCTVLEVPSLEDSEDLLAYRKLLASFHSKLVESIDNPQIIQFYKRASANLARYQYLQLSVEGSGKGMIKDHKKIIRLLKKRAYEEARELLKVHIEKSFQYKISVLKDYMKKSEHETPGHGI